MEEKNQEVIKKENKCLCKNEDLFKKMVFFLGFLILILFVFLAGIKIGERKAHFAFDWFRAYQRNFAGPKKGFFPLKPDFLKDDFLNHHGIFGTILKNDINSSEVVIKDKDNIEKVIKIDEKTIITRFRENIKQSDLKEGEMVMVIGRPLENGQILAKFIRVFPPLNN
ncbi:MAG: hypothetical protein ACPLXL_01880 [Minisyncoccia bacterium]